MCVCQLRRTYILHLPTLKKIACFTKKKRCIVQLVSRRKRRSRFTHVAAICDKKELQASYATDLIRCPDVMFGWKHGAHAQHVLPGTVLAQRERVWNTQFLGAKSVNESQWGVERLVDQHQPVLLLLDALRNHRSFNSLQRLQLMRADGGVLIAACKLVLAN